MGDQVWTDRGSRSELQLGSTVVRLAPTFGGVNLEDIAALTDSGGLDS